MTAMRRLASVLLVVIALTLLLHAAPVPALADAPASTPTMPDPTQISGTLPEPETEGTALIQWGGGTLYQLTARLAVNGCDLNQLWVYDHNQRRYTWPLYTFDGPGFLNMTRIQRPRYKDHIPPTAIGIKCIDMINHVYGYSTV